jgi:site-specific recombinase XerD
MLGGPNDIEPLNPHFGQRPGKVRSTGGQIRERQNLRHGVDFELSGHAGNNCKRSEPNFDPVSKGSLRLPPAVQTRSPALLRSTFKARDICPQCFRYSCPYAATYVCLLAGEVNSPVVFASRPLEVSADHLGDVQRNWMRSYALPNRELAKRYDDWMIAIHYTDSTRRYARKVLGRFNEFLGEGSISCVTHLEIRKFLTHISSLGATLETAYRHLGVLRRFYDFLNLGGVVSYVPPRLVRMKSAKRTDLPILSESEIRRLLAATRTMRERAIVEFIYGTGCRLRESTHLRVEDINFENRCARVHGKFGKIRTVFLTESTVRALRAYMGERTRGYVFQEDRPPQRACLTVGDGSWVASWVDYGRRVPCGAYKAVRRTIGRIDLMSPEAAQAKMKELLIGVRLTRPVPDRPLTNSAILLILTNIGHRAGLKNVGVHILRRSFATHLYDHGATIEIIQALLGHVYLGTTLGYTRLSRARMAKTIDEHHPLALSHEA